MTMANTANSLAGPSSSQGLGLGLGSASPTANARPLRRTETDLSAQSQPTESPATAPTPPSIPVFSDLKLFLQPSFDASQYVSKLVSSASTSAASRAERDSSLTPAANQAATATNTAGAPPQPLPRSPRFDALKPLPPSAADALTLQQQPPDVNGSIPNPHVKPKQEEKREREEEEEQQQQQEREREQDGTSEVDFSLAISRLNLAIEELDKSIRAQVDANASSLLARTAGVATMQTGLADTRHGIAALDREIATLKNKVHSPFVQLQTLTADLACFDAAADLVARTTRFVTVARRVQVQMDAIFSQDQGEKGEKEAFKDSLRDTNRESGASAQDDPEDAVMGVVRGRDLARAALFLNQAMSIIEREKRLGFDASPSNTHAVSLATSTLENPTPEHEHEYKYGYAYETSILSLGLVQDLLPSIESAKKTVTDYMEDMIVKGLRELSPVMLSSSLQTAFNLGTLAPLVRDLVYDLTEVVKERIRAVFDLDSLSRSLRIPIPLLPASSSSSITPSFSSSSPSSSSSTLGYKARRSIETPRSASNSGPGFNPSVGMGVSDSTPHPHPRTPNLNADATTWLTTLWKRIETLIVHEMSAVCTKVYALERVLKLKTDAETGVNFLHAALETLPRPPSWIFWQTLAEVLHSEVETCCTTSPFVGRMLAEGFASSSSSSSSSSSPFSSSSSTQSQTQTQTQTVQQDTAHQPGYTRLVRILSSFFAQVAAYSDIVYDATLQSEQAQMLVGSLANLEARYLDSVTARIGEQVDTGLGLIATGTGTGMGIGMGMGMGQSAAGENVDWKQLETSILNTMDAGRFDPLLLRATASRLLLILESAWRRSVSIPPSSASTAAPAASSSLASTQASGVIVTKSPLSAAVSTPSASACAGLFRLVAALSRSPLLREASLRLRARDLATAIVDHVDTSFRLAPGTGTGRSTDQRDQRDQVEFDSESEIRSLRDQLVSIQVSIATTVSLSM
ncbi:hypothetical protein BCV70DRAFT_200420 [Testicularia cyperi]|uniref:Conserved oligomeric Golgi complex subunit 5 n=1 Tax=Testicularia cyperi TaxID=1882483 RepID=A0A317XR37_9BASI|nr:hypothetical protein BCV70DRAFT_200420 [Testicularia cyperi]